MDLNKLKEAEEYRSKASKALKVGSPFTRRPKTSDTIHSWYLVRHTDWLLHTSFWLTQHCSEPLASRSCFPGLASVLQTSMFGKWKPDYLNAAPYFERAAALYRAGGAEEQAKEMFLKAADCNVRLNT